MSIGRPWVSLILGVVVLSLLAGCRPKVPPKINFGEELPPGAMALRKISPAEYPDFTPAFLYRMGLAQAADNSVAYLQKPSSERFYPYLDITHDRALATVKAFREMVTRVRSGAELNSEICRDYEVYQSIGAPAPDHSGYTNQVLFTGYFTPIYDASLTRGGAYQWPLYKRPVDLVTDPATGETLGRKTAGGVTPYYTRAQIEGQNVLAGQELVFLKSRWEAYVITVQGSARLRLSDGRLYEVGFAGHNGYGYTSPGMKMVEDGAVTRDQLSIRGMAAHFAQVPSDMDKYLWLNQRYVFFSEQRGGPFGCLNVPVAPFRSIATDKSVYPRAMPAFLSVPVPVDESGKTGLFQGFMMDQDAGGAIRASGRCDIYMGIGPEAGKLAGHQLYAGQLYYLAIKPSRMTSTTGPTTMGR